MIKFLMPSLGADMEDGTLVEWRKQPGDILQRGDIIADVDTQKGLIEIEVFDEGILEKQVVKEGEKVPVGTVLALIKPLGDSSKSPLPEAFKSSEPVFASSDVIQENKPELREEKTTKEQRIKISPLARKMAEENHLDISMIKGTGPEGSIVKVDIENAILNQGKEKVEKAETAKMEVVEEKLQIEEKEELEKISSPSSEGIRLAVAAAMSKSNREIPHYYLEKRINLSRSMQWLKETNKDRSVAQRLLPVSLFIKATAKALDDVPDLNATWENGLQRKNEINVGLVVSLRTGGIMVPSIPSADSKSIDEIMEAVNDIIPRARAFKLRSSEISQSTFTITSLGDGGAEKVFGLIYPPQVGIVGFGEISDQPFAENGMLGIHPVVDVTLAADHRATDGLVGSKFLAALNRYLQNPESL